VAVPAAAGPRWTHVFRASSHPETGARLVDRAVEHFGRVDTLVNCAGVFVARPFTEYTDDDFDLITGVNLRGFFRVTRRAIAAMLRNNGTRRGHVVNISTSLVDHASAAVPGEILHVDGGQSAGH
jgi:NAD(P)-dependent dehydrogenase (short-subunit alcohol dehydrogenase family)